MLRRLRPVALALGVAGTVLSALTGGLAVPPAPGAAAAPAVGAAPALIPARANGYGSSYVGPAMGKWVADGQTLGLPVQYTAENSPAGLTRFGDGTVDFAGTEAEFSALSVGTTGGADRRGFQYIPDVAGAVAIMYHAYDTAGRQVDYLHLSPRTVARIFLGDIAYWDHPDILAENTPANLAMPHEPIEVLYRSGQSGTTALFYDFVAHAAPDVFGPWAQSMGFGHLIQRGARIIDLDSTGNRFTPKNRGLGGSDQIADGVKNTPWTIAYDEFAYAISRSVPAAWVQNQAGQWVQPYAENISAALDTATLRPDLTQELSTVYTNPDPKAYPISSYSYIVTECTVTGDWPTCQGPYDNAGVAETMRTWLRYIACEGQDGVAEIGYSPLPPSLSQAMADAIGRMDGVAPEQLTADNCANPRFRGSLGDGATSPPNPYDGLEDDGRGAGGGQAGGAGGGGADPADATVADESAGAGRGDLDAAGGGSDDWRDADPTAYRGRNDSRLGPWPMVTLVGLLAAPPLGGSLWSWYRRRSG